MLTGGNLGNRQQNLAGAADHINRHCGAITAQSAIYETAAWGKTDQPAFLNQVLELETALAPEILLERILWVENRMGRKREEKFGPRLIDIDILLYDDQIVDQGHLQIPHPQLAGRRFALTPLAELAGEYIHPQLGITIAQMLHQCPDGLNVKKFRVTTP